MTLYCASTNPGKLREFRMAAGQTCRIEPLPGLAEIGPPDETEETFEGNAIHKAAYYGQRCEGYLFAEDSGLEVDSLGGAPGVRSARWSGEGATDERNNELLLQRLGGNPNRAARYVCVIALVHNGRLVETFRGAVEGQILYECRGRGGFGYDPLFFYPPFQATFAEVERERKQAVSHRGVALKKLLEYVRAHISE